MSEKEDFLVILIWPIVISLLSIIFDANYLNSTLFFVGLPSLFFTFKDFKTAKKIGIFAFFSSITGTLIFDYLGHATGSWYIETAFQSRFLGLILFESFLWAFLTIYFVIYFYEYFLDHHVTRHLIYPKMKYFIPLTIATSLGLMIVYANISESLSIPYFYLVSGILLFVLPIMVEVVEYPRETRKLVQAGAFFLYFGVIYEITALKLGVWKFPGNSTDYIAKIKLMGVSFPFEELFFWLLLYGMAVIAYYDHWDDYPNH